LDRGIDINSKSNNGCTALHIAAINGTNIDSLLTHINKAHHSAYQKFSTSQLTTILAKAVEHHNPPIVAGKTIKLRYAHLGGHNPPTIVIHGNGATKLPTSYQRYLTGMYQQSLGLTGTVLRLKLKG
jgi:GTP-binding protein